MPLVVMFGPLSGATPGGAGWPLSVAGVVVLVVVWTRYLNRPEGTEVSRYNLFVLSAGCLFMIVFGIWDQFYNR